MADRFSKETAQQRIYRAFESLITEDDQAIDMARAALLIGSVEYPDLDIAQNLAQLDALARRVRSVLALPDQDIMPSLPPEEESLRVLDALNQVLFDEEHFRGNGEDYYNPNNSFFHKVLETHLGIPITLSLLYMEVGRRVGIALDGVGLPHHFMVRCTLPQEIIYIDPYNSGTLMNEQGCRERIWQITQHRVKLHAHWFTPVTHRQLLVRMLNNLKKTYLEAEDYARALPICNFIVRLLPHTPEERRDRGLLHLQLKHYARAIQDLTTYQNLAAEAEDREEMQKYIQMARQMIAMLN